MKLYNTLTRQIESFAPQKDNQVGIYTCGPTVYDRAHIGNLRTYILMDILVKSLQFLGYELTTVMNITDIDDKMIERAEKEGITLSELAERFETLFFEDLARLNIELPDIMPRATEHFIEMKELLNTLIEKGFAYEKNGDVYFSIEKFKTYGRLSQLDKRTIKPGARVDVDEYSKDNVNDFALWKVDEASRTHTHEPTKSPGRPGWHLECSAMAMKYLGETLDLHLGGVDLIFPHHENEIAQSEAATGKPFVKYFVHGEHLLVDNQKMSKSLDNFYTLAEIEEAGFEPVAFRYLMLTSHYRTKINFTLTALSGAQNTIESIRQLAFRPTELTDEKRRAVLETATEALQNDLDLPRVIALLHEANHYDLWLAFEPILGLGLIEPGESAVPDEVRQLAERRLEAKKAGDYTAADQLRLLIQAQSYQIEDTETGYRLIPS